MNLREITPNIVFFGFIFQEQNKYLITTLRTAFKVLLVN